MNTTLSSTTRTTKKTPLSLIAMEPVARIDSYGSVPWYRRQWFALFPPLAPLLIVIALTGGVYAKATTTMRGYSSANVWRYTLAGRVFFVAASVLITVTVPLSIWG